MNQQMIQFEWVLPESEKAAQVKAIELEGGDVEDIGGSYRPRPDELADYLDAGLEPLTLITVTATTVFVIQALTKLWRDRNIRGGTIVDTRGGKLRIRPVPAMPNGQLVLVRDGSPPQVFKHDQENDAKAVLQNLLPTLVKKKQE